MLVNAEAEELSTEPWWPHGRMSACVRLDAVEDAGHKTLAFRLALEKTRAPRSRSRRLSLSLLPPLPLSLLSPLSSLSSPSPPSRSLHRVVRYHQLIAFTINHH